MRPGVHLKTVADIDALKLKAEATGPGAVKPEARAVKAGYPKPIGEAAHIGLVGEFIRMVEPHTEADRNFLSVQFLVYAGYIAGRRAHVYAGDVHHSNLFVCGVGLTNTGRKGTATAPIRKALVGINQDIDGCISGVAPGASSGEGVIYAIRDPLMKGNAVVDEGVKDKRLMIHEGEFAATLAACNRDGNTLASILRTGWDGTSVLGALVKTSPIRATGAHICFVANITKDELLNSIARGIDNGLANRFLWCCSERSKILPSGGKKILSVDWTAWRQRFGKNIDLVNGLVELDAEAAELWGTDERPEGGAYEKLTGKRNGMFGAAVGRAAPQTLRIALVYALLDGAPAITKAHLLAALEVWRYCEDSAKYIFGTGLTNRNANDILGCLKEYPEGVSR